MDTRHYSLVAMLGRFRAGWLFVSFEPEAGALLEGSRRWHGDEAIR